MTQDSLFEKLYGDQEPRPEEECTVVPHLKARSARTYLEYLKNGRQPGDPRKPDTGSESD